MILITIYFIFSTILYNSTKHINVLRAFLLLGPLLNSVHTVSSVQGFAVN